MIDRNIFLLKQIVFMFNFDLCFGYGPCLSRRTFRIFLPNVKTGSMSSKYGCLFSAFFYYKVIPVIINALRTFLVGCSDCRFLVL